jgi:MFS-type transporter involved in bile tolerance (Atg22 family)
MRLFAHHMGVELFGKEFAPETPLEHALAFFITGLLFALIVYGAYAACRDLLRWRRSEKERPG